MIHPEVRETAKKIRDLEIQGAEDVAEHGLRALAKAAESLDEEDFIKQFNKNTEKIVGARPTEPALRNGVNFVFRSIKSASDSEDAAKAVKKAVKNYIESLEEATEKIVEIGSKRIKDGQTIFTHCHSNTVTSVLKSAFKEKDFSVICTETRPRYQGRITAKELLDAGIEVTMIVDNAARSFINDADLVMTGADAVTSDGYVVNKIGTSMIGLAAKEARTSFCVACQTFKFDPVTLMGEYEPIEQRDSDEVWEGAPHNLKILNPAFDFTPPEYVNFMITDEGIITPYDTDRIIREKYR